MGTASADKTARIWGVDSGRCLTFYTGHTGSVNGISFHPTQDLVLTASGDGSAHIWKASPILPEGLMSGDNYVLKYQFIKLNEVEFWYTTGKFHVFMYFRWRNWDTIK